MLFVGWTGGARSQEATQPSAPASVATPAASSTAASGAATIDCNATVAAPKVGGASLAQNPTASAQSKSWQAPYGAIEFTIDSFEPIPADASIGICFRWAQHPKESSYREPIRPTRLEFSSDRKELKITTVVANPSGPQPPRFASKENPNAGEYAVWLVPLAEVRILVVSNDAKQTVVDVTTRIGITNVFWALLLAMATVVTAFVALNIISLKRLRIVGLKDVSPLLRVIATQDGYASLSQFQILLWTFLVGASAIYVMALSGELIEVTNGTLVLLGISGAATVGAKVYGNNQSAAAAAAQPTAAEQDQHGRTEKEQAASANAQTEQAAALGGVNEKAAADTDTAKAATTLGPSATPHTPKWSDLVVSDSGDGGEIDIARVQMLYFTLIGAAFVLMQVGTTYVIPEIPNGFLILMGISNGVYLGSKFAGSP